MYLFKSVLVLITALLFFSCNSSEEPYPQNWSWEMVVSSDGSVPIARHEAAFVVVGNQFYLLGGRGILPTSIYNTTTNSWSEGAAPPIELHHFQPIVWEEKVYVIAALTGGYPAEIPTEHIYIYDPAFDEWEIGDEIPEARRRGSTGNVVYGNTVYIAAGIKNGHIGDHKQWMDSYDLVTGEWIELSDAPRARDHFQAVVFENKIYMAAGRNSQAPTNTFSGTIAEVDVYDIESNTWSILPEPLPTQRAGNMAALFKDQILVIGGESDTQEEAHSEVEALNPETGEWDIFPSLVRGRHGSGLILFDGKLFTVSGSGNRGGEPELESLEVFTKNDR